MKLILIECHTYDEAMNFVCSPLCAELVRQGYEEVRRTREVKSL